MVQTGDINLEVDYQRDVVWTGQSSRITFDIHRP
jgi:hypothetical protein